MFKTISFLFLALSLVSCNSETGAGNTTDNCEMITQDDGTTQSSCTVDGEAPTTTGGATSGGQTTGGSTTGGGTTTGGTTTGGSTTGGSTTGGTTGGTTTGGTSGGTSDGVPTQALTWDANIYFTNFNNTQEAKVEKAVELMKKVIASKAFRDRVINFTYNGKKTYVDNGGFTNSQIYQIILDGAEKMGVTSKNNTLDVELELYYAATSTIGYTYPNVTRIWMNTKYFNNYTANQVAGNLMHEWVHKLGFGHASSYSVSRDSSVPYAIGYIMQELTKQYK